MPSLANINQAAVTASRTYNEFRQKLNQSECSLCPSLCEKRSHIVVDRGNPASKIVLIGEAPGENEDLQGLSFVGRAGQLLDQIMASIGLDTNQDTLILNVVKCRPPENRKPTPAEAKNCWPFLKWQLEFVKPRVVVLLGATAAKYFLPKESEGSMKDRVGKFFGAVDFPSIRFFLLYHPAYLLRDPRKKKDMNEHVQELQRALKLDQLLPRRSS